MARLDRYMTRRLFLGVTLGGATASLLAACAPAQQAAPAKPTEAAKPAATQAAPAAVPAATKPAAEAAKPAAQSVAPTPVPVSGVPKKGPGANFDWKQFSGESLTILFSKHPWSTAAEEALPMFTETTGIKVNFEDLPEIQARQKLAVDFAGGGGTYDGMFSSLHVEKIQFWKSGWYLPLNDLLNDSKLLSPEFDWDDTVDSAKQAATSPDGKILALPAFTDVIIMAYRKDIVEQKGIKLPQDHTELEAAIKAAHEPPNVYGWASRGLKNANMTMWPTQFFNFGGQYFDKDMKSKLNSDAGVQATDWYARMDREFGPPGVVNFNWYEATAAFMQGQVAFMQDGINFFTQYEDETKSRVKGKTGYMLMPKGPAGNFPPTYTPGMAVSAKSKKPGPAFLLAQYLTGKGQGIRAQLAGVGVARLSTWDDPQVKAKQSMPQDWTDAFLQGMKIGKPGLPEIAAVTQYRDDVGALLQATIEGGDAKQVTQQMHQAFQAILDKEPK